MAPTSTKAKKRKEIVAGLLKEMRSSSMKYDVTNFWRDNIDPYYNFISIHAWRKKHQRTLKNEPSFTTATSKKRENNSHETIAKKKKAIITALLNDMMKKSSSSSSSSNKNKQKDYDVTNFWRENIEPFYKFISLHAWRKQHVRVLKKKKEERNSTTTTQKISNDVVSVANQTEVSQSQTQLGEKSKKKISLLFLSPFFYV